jgi:uncharacterized protein YggE
MKKLWLAVAVGAVLIMSVVGVTGCTGDEGVVLGSTDGEIKLSLNSQQEGIWVSGTGKVYAEPDIAVLRLGVEVQRETVAQAQSEATEAMDRVIESLKGQGVDEKDIQTQYFNIQKVSRWDKVYEEGGEQEIIIGYRVTNIVSARIRDVEKAGEVIDAVAAAGGDLTRIDSINFEIDDPTPYYEQAREQAIDYARAKAEQMAEVAGINLGKATYLTENTYYASSNYYGRDMAVYEPAPVVPASISPGEMEITTTVQIAFSIVD